MDQNLVNQFRKRLSDVLTPSDTDAILKKWLKAGNFCLRRSEYLFREGLACSVLHDMENRAKNFKKNEIFEKYEFVTPLGVAKDGTPLSYVAMGRGDYKGIIHSVSSWDICVYCSTRFECDIRRAQEQSRKTGKEINEVTYIIDMENFSLRRTVHQEVLETAFDLFRMMQDHFPERWKVLLVVNAAFYFYQAFNIFKPIFRNVVLQNVHVVSKENTPSLLLKYIDEDVLPTFLGGQRIDSKGDPMCREFIKFGGLVPEERFLSLRPQLQSSEAGVQTLWMRARSFYNHSVVVFIPNSRVHVEIRTEGGSIATTILFRDLDSDDSSEPDVPAFDEYLNEHDDNSNIRLISPSVKLQTHISPVDTYVKLPWKGLYVFRFDNYHNWITGRTLIYRIRLEPPNS